MIWLNYYYYYHYYNYYYYCYYQSLHHNHHHHPHHNCQSDLATQNGDEALIEGSSSLIISTCMCACVYMIYSYKHMYLGNSTLLPACRSRASLWKRRVAIGCDWEISAEKLPVDHTYIIHSITFSVAKVVSMHRWTRRSRTHFAIVWKQNAKSHTQRRGGLIPGSYIRPYVRSDRPCIPGCPRHWVKMPIDEGINKGKPTRYQYFFFCIK